MEGAGDGEFFHAFFVHKTYEIGFFSREGRKFKFCRSGGGGRAGAAHAERHVRAGHDPAGARHRARRQGESTVGLGRQVERGTVVGGGECFAWLEFLERVLFLIRLFS